MSQPSSRGLRSFLPGKSSHRKGRESVGLIDNQDMRPVKQQDGNPKYLPRAGSTSSKSALGNLKLFHRSQVSSPASPALPPEDAGVTPPSGALITMPLQQQQQQFHSPTPAHYYPVPSDDSTFEKVAPYQSVVPLFTELSYIQKGTELDGDPATIHQAPVPAQAQAQDESQGPHLQPLAAATPLNLSIQDPAAGWTVPSSDAYQVLDPRMAWGGSMSSATSAFSSQPQVSHELPAVSELSAVPVSSEDEPESHEKEPSGGSPSVVRTAPLRINRAPPVMFHAATEGKTLSLDEFEEAGREPKSPAHAIEGHGEAGDHPRGAGARDQNKSAELQEEIESSQRLLVNHKRPLAEAEGQPELPMPSQAANTLMVGERDSRPPTASDAAASDSDCFLSEKGSKPAPGKLQKVNEGTSLPADRGEHPVQAADLINASALLAGSWPEDSNSTAVHSPSKAPISPERRSQSQEVRIEKMIGPHNPDIVVGEDGTVNWLETLLVFVPKVLARGDLYNSKNPEVAGGKASGSRTTSSSRWSALSSKTDRHLQEENATLRSKLAALESTKKRLQEDIDVVTRRVGRREETIRQLDSTIAQKNSWCDGLNATISSLKRDLDDSTARLSRADADRSMLQSGLTKAQEQAIKYRDSAERWAQDLNNERANSQAELAALEECYKEEITKTTMAHDAALRDSNARFIEELKRVQRDHMGQVEALNRRIADMSHAHEAEVDVLKNEHAAEVEGLKTQNTKAVAEVKTKLEKETRNLRNRMAAYSANTYTAIPDSDLVVSLRRLVQDINNLSLYVPQPVGYVPSPEVDPTNHVSRSLARGSSSSTWPRFVQSVCWAVALRGFFHLPLGFGALGCQGPGSEVLLPIFETFVGADLTELGSTSPVLPQDKESNAGRAWLFASILRDVKNSDNADAVEAYGTSALAAMFEDNASLVARDLTAQLQHISNGGLDPDAEAQVSGVVRAMGIFALELGSQRAQIVLETCRYGDAVGDRFVDGKRNGAGAGAGGWGQDTVDIMTQPALVRTGDGREDLATQKVIVKGDVIAL